jgi:hypothetical protein
MEKKSKAALILALGKPEKGEEGEEGEEMGEGKKAAASALLAAIKDDNAEAVAEAFSDLYEMC